MGDEPLVARLLYILGENEDDKIQPAGDYLVADDMLEVEVEEFSA